MPTTKSGIDTPADAPTKPNSAPVKNYPGSSKLGGGSGGAVDGPASGAYQGHGRRK